MEARVKKLEWHDRGEMVHPRYVADSIIGTYAISRTKGGQFEWWTSATRGKICVGTIEAAQAAVQEHLDAAILSALEPTPSVGEVERLRKALRKADQFITNGIELGYIRMPDAGTPDPAHETPGIVRAALTGGSNG